MPLDNSRLIACSRILRTHTTRTVVRIQWCYEVHCPLFWGRACYAVQTPRWRQLKQHIRQNVVTTTFTYDNNGNVTQKTVDSTTTTYVYDYANRLTALGILGATTTYAYDWAGSRVSQTGTSTTYVYPFKWYSVKVRNH